MCQGYKPSTGSFLDTKNLLFGIVQLRKEEQSLSLVNNSNNIQRKKSTNFVLKHLIIKTIFNFIHNFE